MANIYYRKIINKEVNSTNGKAWNINDVPERWREEVRELLDGSVLGTN